MRKVLLLIFLSILSLDGCTQTVPKCSSEDAQAQVLSIVRSELKQQMKGMAEIKQHRDISDAEWEKGWKSIKGGIKTSLENIITHESDEKIGSYFCSARLIVDLEGTRKTIPITYTSKADPKSPDGYTIKVNGLETITNYIFLF